MCEWNLVPATGHSLGAWVSLACGVSCGSECGLSKQDEWASLTSSHGVGIVQIPKSSYTGHQCE